MTEYRRILLDGFPVQTVRHGDELVAEVLERGEHRIGRRLAETAQGAALDDAREPLEAFEVVTLIDMLPSYVAHLTANRDSLLCRFYGCFAMQVRAPAAAAAAHARAHSMVR